MQFLELRIPPVLQLILIAVAMWALKQAFPALEAPIPGSIGFTAGFVGAGSIVALLGVIEFRKARTTVDPRFPERTERMVVSGVYRISRNPMYLGFVLILLGWACCLANSLSFLLIPVFVYYIDRFQIQPEERCMLSRFGDEFKAYAARVRRWI